MIVLRLEDDAMEHDYTEMSSLDLIEAYEGFVIDGEPAPLDLLAALDNHGLLHVSKFN